MVIVWFQSTQKLLGLEKLNYSFFLARQVRREKLCLMDVF